MNISPPSNDQMGATLAIAIYISRSLVSLPEKNTDIKYIIKTVSFHFIFYTLCHLLTYKVGILSNLLIPLDTCITNNVECFAIRQKISSKT